MMGYKINSNLLSKWRGMRKRCGPKPHHSSYLGCEIDLRFMAFEDFQQWAVRQIGHDQNWELDKDVLVRGNRIYGPDTCVFIPQALNTILLRSKKSNRTLPVGVQRDRNPNKYRAVVSCNDKLVHLGTFESVGQAFTAYKTKKEEIIRELATKWRDSIDPRVFDALMAYSIEITD